MKFKHGTRRKAAEYEKDIAEQWKKNGTFEKSVEQRTEDNAYVFYDGPPFITGNPHHGTLLSTIIKDIVPRYQTMKGKRVERVWGWDCHGLPAENFTEKHLNGTVSRKAGGSPDELILKSGSETKNISLEEYITTARDLMVANSALWESYVERVGRWVDFKGAYRTMDKDFMESVWWAFKELYDHGKIYEGEKVLMYDTKFATPVSKNEVTMDNDAYRTVTDPSVYVKFKVGKDFKPVTNFEIGEISGSIMYDITDYINGFDWPEKIGDLCFKNNEFHISLIKIAEDLDEKTRAKIEKISKEAGAKLKTTPKLTGEFLRLVDDERGRETIIALMEWEELEEWRNKIREIVPNANFAIPHTTLYTNGCLGISYNKENKKFEHKLDEKTEKILREAMNKKREPKYLLAWTTTPWTLPANMALAVNPALKYVEVAVGGEHLILAKDLAEKVLVDEKHQPLPYEIVREMSGEELVGLQYVPIFSEENASVVSETAHKVYAADFVEDEGGTGIVHIAPAYGVDDYELAQANDIPTLHAIDDNGYYLPEFAAKLEQIGVKPTDETGIEVWAANKFIAKCLEEQGKVWKIEYIQHEYPFNPRSKQRIMYRAIPSWFFDIQGQKSLMLAKNENINWFPPHLKHGRFAKNIDQAPDWTLSRNRFWATAMPVWKGDKGTVKVVGSYAELAELSGQKLGDYHRPWVDKVEFDIDGEHFTRIEEVLDGWFESGSMPFAQFHYPFENKAKFEANYPADFIVEYIGQVRAWFYYIHAINTALAEAGSFGELPDNQIKPDDLADKKLVFFDLNGTIISTAECSMRSYRAALNDYLGVEESERRFPDSLLKTFLEIPLGQKLQENGFSDDDVEKILPIYYQYNEQFEYLNKPVKNTVDLIKKLHKQGVILCCITLKQEEPASKMLAQSGVADCFSDVLFRDTERNKTEQVKMLLEKHNVSAKDSIFIGNMPYDEVGARDNGVEYIDESRVNEKNIESNAFKNVIVTGTIAGEDGRKMSKSLGNYTDPMELMDKFSADSLRFLLASSPLLSGEDFSLKDKDVSDVARKLAMIWNMYDFFTMYAEVDGWEYGAKKDEFLRVITDKDFDKNAPDFDNDNSHERRAARAIVKNADGKIALIHAQKYNYYKLPGGGIDDGETIEGALARELDEEIGAKAKILGEVGVIEEFRANEKNLHQISYCYYGEVVGDVGENHLEEEEEQHGFKTLWVDLDEAIELTKSGNFKSEVSDQQFMALRDETLLLEYKKILRSQNVPTISLSDLANPLDKWIVSRVHELRNHITKYLDEYNLPDAMSAILPMVDDASNWYVRRSRRRFWKSEDDGDKDDAYRTLHYVLVYLSQILAPFVPFLAEELYQKLTGGESVHLLDWPEAGEVDEKVLAEMTRTREIIEKGLALRMDREDEFGQIKVRQPLAKLEYGGEKLDDFYEQIIADEVNVKAVIASNVKRSSNKKRLDRVGNELPRDDDGGAVLLDKELTPELKREGQAREIIRQIQNARKEAGLNVDDRIVVKITTDNKELEQAVVEHSETITAEILATKFADNDGYQTTASIDGVELKVQLKKA